MPSEARPENLTRSFFHMVNALGCAAILVAFPDIRVHLGLLVPVAVAVWLTEAVRKVSPAYNAWVMGWFRAVAHPHEHHTVNSASWYVTAMLLMALADVPEASLVGLCVLGVGDPIAGFVGRRFGTTQWMRGKSIQGTGAFVVGSFLCAWAALAFAHPELGSRGALAAAAGAVMGALAEGALPWPDDNFNVPILATCAAYGVIEIL